MYAVMDPADKRQNDEKLRLEAQFRILIKKVAQNHDRQAFAQLFDHFAPRLKSFMMRKNASAELAEDLVQEAMIAVWTKAGLYEPSKGSVTTWVFTIARNHFLNDLRRTRRETQLEEGQAEAALVSDAEQEEGLNLGDLHRALNRLPPERREALLLVGASGFSYEEAAQVCGVAVGTIKSRVARGRAQLAQILDAGDRPPVQPSAG